MRTAWQDFRHSLRLLWRSPGFTIVAVLCLALGVGANTAVFSVVNNVLLRPLPYRDPDRLAAVYENNAKRGVRMFTVCPADFQDWRDEMRSFESIAAYRAWNPNLSGVDEPERLDAVQVSGDFFGVLGVAPAAGRVIQPEDETQRARVAVLSHRLWDRFGRNPDLIGQSIRLDGEAYLIAGIMPAGFRFPNTDVDLWTPLALDPSRRDRGEHDLLVIARLNPAASLESARSEISALMRRIDKQFGNAGCGADLAMLHDWFVGDSRRTFWTLLGAVGLVLLIACANISNLLLARGSRRAHELSIRSYLGASRRRLIAQLLMESVCLGLMGGALGLLLSVWGSDLLVSLLPAGTTTVFGAAAIDWRVLGYTLALSLVSGLIFGVAPALRASLASASSYQSGARISKSRLRNALLVAQTALALILLTGTGLLIRSFLGVYRIDPGFDTANVLTARIDLAARHNSGQGPAVFYQELLERLAPMPGVVSAAAVTHVPLSGGGNSGYISFEGRPAAPLENHPGASRLIVSPDYFRALKIPLREGRAFSDGDHASAPPVVIINQTLARRYWPGENPVGRRMKRGTLTAPFPWMTVVGVVADVKQNSLTGAVSPTIYLPYLQTPTPGMTVMVRAESDPENLATAIRTAVRSIDKDQPVASIRTLEEVHWGILASRRTVAVWMLVFAAVALILAALGIYGVTAYAAARRTREFGIRIALGANKNEVLGVALQQSMISVAAGIVLGLAGAAGLTRLLSGWLFGVTPTDAVSFAGAAAFFAFTALLASYLPARRAASLDPVNALRHE